MDAKKFRLHDFISEKRTFVIPVYQRDYKWKTTHCEQLFNDIVQIIKNGNPHFIGTFVYQETAGADIFRDLVIIDGQQRITSIILFVKALYDLTDNEDLKEDIHSTFIKHSKGELKGKCKLRPTEFDRNTFEKLMADDGFDENNFSSEEKNSAMYCNYRFFQKKISESTLYVPKDFYKATGQLNIVSILLEEEENPQEIFESLNSTGLDLSQADLIRNYVLMQFVDYKMQEKLYRNYWREIEDLLRPTEEMETFLGQYLIAKLKSLDAYSTKISSTTLYVVFKRYFKEKDTTPEECLRDMLRYAKYFYRIMFDESTLFKNLSALDKKLYELVYLLNTSNTPSIIMYLLDRNERDSFDEETFISFVDALISLTTRAKICGNSGITSQFAGNLIARLDKERVLDTKTFWKAVTFGKGKSAFPRDKDFQVTLATKPIYKARENGFCKYILYSLERKVRDKELPAYSEATIEHIMPQKLNDSWEKYLAAQNDTSAYEFLLHNLGNLTLTEYNSELSNSAFDNKKKIYEQSHYFYTKTLSSLNDWTSVQIQLRAKKLAAAALKIWTLPEEFNIETENMPIGNTFNLDSDFDELAGEKPTALYIADNKIKISNWSELAREVVLKLYSLDKDIFRQIVQMKNVPRRNSLTSTMKKSGYTIQIDENYYMSAWFQTAKLLKIIQALVENFDRLYGSEFKDKIYFTIRRG